MKVTGYYLMERGNIINYLIDREAALALARAELARDARRPIQVWTNTGELVQIVRHCEAS